MESTELPACTLTQATGTAEGQLIKIHSFGLRSERAEEPLGGLECWKYSDQISQSKLEWFSRGEKHMDQSLLRWRKIISLHEGAEMMVTSPAGNSPGFHITMTSRKRDASGKANSESDVSSSQRRQLRGSYVRGSWRSSWEASSVCRDGSSSGLPDLSELPGWIQRPGGATHHSLALLSLPALCFPLNRRNVGTWVLEAVTHPDQEPSVAEPCELQSAHCSPGRSPEHFDLSLFCRWMITGSSLHLPLLWFPHL